MIIFSFVDLKTEDIKKFLRVETSNLSKCDEKFLSNNMRGPISWFNYVYGFSYDRPQ